MKDVLEIEQMQRLSELGVDVSDATCYWTSIQDRDYKPISWLPIFRDEDDPGIEILEEKFPLTYQKGNIFYAYTIEDMIRKIRNYDDVTEFYIEQSDKRNVVGCSFTDQKKCLEVDIETTLKDSLFELYVLIVKRDV